MKRRARIFYTSDIHGQLFPTDWRDRKPKAAGLATLRQAFRKDGNTLIIDGGDSLQGSPLTHYYHLQNRPEAIAEAMNEAGYDYVTLGNHDFNYGIEYMERYLNALHARVLCENYRDEEGKILFPHTVHTLENGLKLGLVGAVTDSVNLWEKKENLRGRRVTDVVESLRDLAFRLRPQVDLLICIYHGGYEGSLETFERTEKGRENVGIELCRSLPFDLLLAAHQHMFTEGRKVGTCFTLQNAPGAAGCFEIEMEEEEDGHFSVKSRSYAAGDFPAGAMAADFDAVQDFVDRVIGHLPEELRPGSHVEMALRGSRLADWINEIQRKTTGAELSCTSFANHIPGLPREVRMRDLLLTYPFANNLCCVEVSGAVLRRALERSASYLEYRGQGAEACLSSERCCEDYEVAKHFLFPKVEHYNYDFFLGLEAQIEYAADVGQRVKAVKIGGEDLCEERLYSLAMNSYRATGAGGYEFYADCPVLYRDERDVFEILCDSFSGEQSAGRAQTT